MATEGSSGVPFLARTHLGLAGIHLGPFWPPFGRFGFILDRFGHHFGAIWALLGLLLEHLRPFWNIMVPLWVPTLQKKGSAACAEGILNLA